MKLSEKEKFILNNLAIGTTISQIAEFSCYSPRQIKRNIKKLYEKFNVTNTNALCYEWGKIQCSSCFKKITKN